MSVLLNPVPFSTDIADLLGYLFSYINLIAANISPAGHNVTVSAGYDGSSVC